MTIEAYSLRWLVGEYEQSFAFLKLAKREQRVRHLILEFGRRTSRPSPAHPTGSATARSMSSSPTACA